MVPAQEQKWGVGPERKGPREMGCCRRGDRDGQEDEICVWKDGESKDEAKEMLRAILGVAPKQPWH